MIPFGYEQFWFELENTLYLLAISYGAYPPQPLFRPFHCAIFFLTLMRIAKKMQDAVREKPLDFAALPPYPRKIKV